MATAYAEDEKKEGVFEKIFDTALSPLDSILGGATELDRIVVTPSRAEESIAASSSSISVIGTEDFERKKIDTVKEALKEETGIDVVQSGAFQGQTDLLIRGGSSNQTLILIDGIKAYDPISPGGSYNLAHLTLDNVQQIEILKGPQSALYGSEALAGVVSIASKKAEKPYVNLSWEGGSFYTYEERFEMGSVHNNFHYSFAGSRLDTKGLSQAEAKHNNGERDPYDRTSLAGRVDYDIGDKASIGSTIRYTKAHFAFDQGADRDDDNAFCTFYDTFTSIYGDYKMFDWWTHNIRLGWMNTKRQYYDDDSPGFDFDRSKYFGRYFKLDYQSTFDIADFDKFIVGYDYNEESASFTSQNDYSGFMAVDTMGEVSAKENAIYAENRFNYADRLTSTQGVRMSGHSRAGNHLTYRVDASYMFATGTKVRGLVATGFKAPSLYELFAPSSAWFGGGNPNLQPEKSFSYEYGLEQYLAGDRAVAKVTYFYTLYRNLIDAITNPNTFVTDQYINIGKAQVYGIEASLKLKPAEKVMLEGGLTYQNSKDFTNDQEMIRRPKYKFFVECFYQATDKLSFDTRVRYKGPDSDNLSSAFANTYKVKGYTVVDMVINYDLTKNFSFYVKMNNLFNKHYEDVRGYTASPFAAYGGVKAKF